MCCVCMWMYYVYVCVSVYIYNVIYDSVYIIIDK